jgi:hypothetical protein
MVDLNKDLANNILEAFTHPRTPSEPQDKATLEKTNAQLESITGTLNNQNDAIKKALVLLAMEQGHVDGLPLRPEVKEELDKIIDSNLSSVTLGNKAAMYVSLLLGQVTSKDKTLYLAVEAGLNNNLGPLYTKIHEIKLANKLGSNATVNNDSEKDAQHPPSVSRKL